MSTEKRQGRLWTILSSSPRNPGILESEEIKNKEGRVTGRIDILSRGLFHSPLRVEHRPDDSSCREKRVVADEILVTFHKPPRGWWARLRLKLRGLKVVEACDPDRKTYLLRRSKLLSVPFLRLPPKPLTSWVERAVDKVENLGFLGVEAAEENAVFGTAGHSDPLKQEQWDHDVIRTEAAHARLQDWEKCEPEVVAVIDSGVDDRHEDLWIDERSKSFLRCRGSLLYRLYCWLFGHRHDDFMDEWHSHGTGCAAPIAAKVDNETGIIGVGLHAKVMALKFMGPDGMGTAADAVKAIHYAIEQKVPVLLLAWGGSCGSACLKQALEGAAKEDILVVAAAGNRGEELQADGPSFYPACYKPCIDNMLVVAGTEKRCLEEKRVAGSNYGVEVVNIAAPGLQCKATRAGRRLYGSSRETSRYGYFSGTSASAALVAGTCALVRLHLRLNNECKFSPTAEEVKGIILKGACPVDALCGEVKGGRRLDVLRCVQPPIEANP